MSITLGWTWNTHFDSGREEVPQNLYNVVASKEEVEICGPNLRSLNLGRTLHDVVALLSFPITYCAA